MLSRKEFSGFYLRCMAINRWFLYLVLAHWNSYAELSWTSSRRRWMDCCTFKFWDYLPRKRFSSNRSWCRKNKIYAPSDCTCLKPAHGIILQQVYSIKAINKPTKFFLMESNNGNFESTISILVNCIEHAVGVFYFS